MSPELAATLMILVSGATHAVVNAILKSGQDKMSSRALIDGSSALILLPAIVFVALPHGAWMWLGLSWAVHTVYLLCLIKAFEATDMSVAYPISRGIAPMLAAAVAAGVFKEPITLVVVVGVAMVSAGVLAAGVSRHVPRRALVWAGLTGVMVALYTVIDAQGVRAAPSAVSYIVWVFVIDGFGIALLFALWRGPRFLLAARAEWKPGVIAGGLSIVTYGLALWAYRLGDTPRLAALRETSILVGVAIAVIFLKERLTAGRLAGVLAIAAGAGLLIASS